MTSASALHRGSTTRFARFVIAALVTVGLACAGIAATPMSSAQAAGATDTLGENEVDMHRLYNPNSGEHFYTALVAERDMLIEAGWRYEGIGWRAPRTGGDPTYRLYNPNVGDHHYTTSAPERDSLVSKGWRYEGIGWDSATGVDTMPLYRLYNPNAVSGTHNYTASGGERDSLLGRGWRDEGIAWQATSIATNAYSDAQVRAAPKTPVGAVESDYAYLVDINSGAVLLDRNGGQRMYPASMTKMMTAILAIENLPDLDRKVTMTNGMWAGLRKANASVAGYGPGTTPTVRDLLYGCLLPSGADATNALAITVSGSTGGFVNLMNQKAAQIGMTSTHFANPTGLHDGSHYSTARDMARLMAYCLQNGTFRAIIATPSYTSTTGVTVTSTVWPRIDGTIQGFEGGKSGYTGRAGRCLSSSASFNGMHLVLVTAHAAASDGAFHDASTIYHWAEQYDGEQVTGSLT